MGYVTASKPFSVEGMVVVITGWGTGIGLMMIKAFASNGAAKVYIVGRRKEKLEETAKQSPSIIPIVGDVTSKESLCKIAEQIKSETGFINLLCCNSGYMPPPAGVKSTDVSVQEFARKALEQKTQDWEKTFSTNSISVVFCSLAFLELLDAGNLKGNCAERKSQVLVTSSIAGYFRVPSNFGAYPASKTATTHIVKHLAGTLAPWSIRVDAIAPGLFPSELATGLIAQGGETNKDPSDEGAFAKDFRKEVNWERVFCLQNLWTSKASYKVLGQTTVLSPSETKLNLLLHHASSLFHPSGTIG